MSGNGSSRPVTRVVIAGGGTAGWIAAAAFAKHLGQLVEVTLVESDEIGTVGVGESTIPTTRGFHDFLGIDEQAFIRATGATFKLGIAFENWRTIGDRYFHPFGTTGRSVLLAGFQHFWLEARAHGADEPYGAYSLETQAAAAGLFATGKGGPLSYAYHLDASAYARFLRGLAEAGGVVRVEGRIAHVEQHENGDVAALTLARGERIEGDLFIDCTGFRALLIEDTLATGFEDWTRWLSTDSAFAVQTESVGEPVPYTRAIAHDAGWRWRIPLQNRVGNGLVFASAYMAEEDAKARLLADIEGRPLFEPRLIRYRTGRRKQAWNRNVVALGLAGGFIEPLESTSIHLVMIAVSRILQLFPFGGVDEPLRARFNALSRAEWEHVRDFIILHYKVTERGDTPFWRGCRDMEVPESLAARIAAFAADALAWQDGEDLFRPESWVHVMLGQGITPASHHRLAQPMAAGMLAHMLADLRANIAATLPKLPLHAEFVRRYAAAQ